MAGKNGLEDRVKALESHNEKLVEVLETHGIRVPSDDDADKDSSEPVDWPIT